MSAKSINCTCSYNAHDIARRSTVICSATLFGQSLPASAGSPSNLKNE